MARVGFADMRRMMGGAAPWSPPSGCVLWLCAAKSGTVAPGGTWVDQSGAGNDATLVGDAYVDGVGLRLEGDDYAALALPPMFSYAAHPNFLTTFTALAWTSRALDVDAGWLTEATLGLFFTSDNKLRLYIKLTSSISYNIFSDIVGETLHGGVIFDGSDASLVTNASIGESQRVLRRSDSAYYGTARLGTTLAGWIDDLMVFSRALSAAEILDIYANSPGSHAP